MNRKVLAVVMIIGLCSLPALAQEQEQRQGLSISEWLKLLQRRIEQIIPKKVVPVSTGVAGTRGAKEDSQAKLYWKGKKGEETVTEEELAEFRECVDFAAKDDRANAVRKLEEFMKHYPDSSLIPDAKKTLDLVNAEGQKAAPK